MPRSKLQNESHDESSSGSMMLVGLAVAAIVVVVVVMVMKGGKNPNPDSTNNDANPALKEEVFDEDQAAKNGQDESLQLFAVRTETATASETPSAAVRYDSDNDDNENENENENENQNDNEENEKIDTIVGAKVSVADQANGAGAAPDQMCHRATECPGRGARSHFHEILQNGKWSKRDELDGKKKGIVTGAPLQRARYTLQEPSLRVTDFQKAFHQKNKPVHFELYHNEFEKSDKLMAKLLRAQGNLVGTNEQAATIAMGLHNVWE